MSIGRIKTKYLSWLLGLIIITTTPVLAADNSEDEGYEEEYIVTATRIPKSVSETPGMTETISGEEVEKGIDTVAEALIEQGFLVSTGGGEHSTAFVQMDGVNDSRLQIMVNGVSMSPNATGNVDLSFFPTTGLDRIEVVHGPLSALYGANALGGVVNIITDLTGEPENTLSLTGGSFSSHRLGATMKRENWGLAVGGNATDGFRTHSASEGYYLSGQYDISQTEGEYLILRGNYMTKDSQQPGWITLPLEDDQFDQRLMADLTGKTNWLNGTWEYKIFGQKYETDYESYIKETGVTTRDSHIVENYGVDVAALYEVANHEVLAGTVFKVDSVDSTTSGKHSLNNFGLYLQDLWYISGDLLLLSGLRWDYNSEYGSPLSPRLNLTKYFTEDLNISMAYGEAFSAPSISDLYDVYEDPLYHFYGNPDLKPEKSKRFDITGNWRRGESFFIVNIYRALIEDGIAYTDDFTSKINIEKIKINGLNINMETSLTASLTGRLGYNWLEKMEMDNSTGQYTPNMEYGEHRWNLGLKYKKTNLVSGINWQIVSGRSALPDYNLLGINLRYGINQFLSLSLAANNLTDEEYQINDGFPMPGRNFSAGLSYNF